MKPLIFWSGFQWKKDFLKNYEVIGLNYKKFENFRGEYVIRILEKSDDSGILMGILQEFWSEYWWEPLESNTSDDEFLKNFDQNSGWKCSCSWLENSYGIFQEFWSEYHWWESLVANTSDNFIILWKIQSEFSCFIFIRSPVRKRSF